MYSAAADLTLQSLHVLGNEMYTRVPSSASLGNAQTTAMNTAFLQHHGAQWACKVQKYPCSSRSPDYGRMLDRIASIGTLRNVYG